MNPQGPDGRLLVGKLLVGMGLFVAVAGGALAFAGLFPKLIGYVLVAVGAGDVLAGVLMMKFGRK